MNAKPRKEWDKFGIEGWWYEASTERWRIHCAHNSPESIHNSCIIAHTLALFFIVRGIP